MLDISNESVHSNDLAVYYDAKYSCDSVSIIVQWHSQEYPSAYQHSEEEGYFKALNNTCNIKGELILGVVNFILACLLLNENVWNAFLSTLLWLYSKCGTYAFIYYCQMIKSCICWFPMVHYLPLLFSVCCLTESMLLT